jgi:hypothetical protein
MVGNHRVDGIVSQPGAKPWIDGALFEGHVFGQPTPQSPDGVVHGVQGRRTRTATEVERQALDGTQVRDQVAVGINDVPNGRFVVDHRIHGPSDRDR